MNLSYATTCPPYAGETTDSAVHVAGVSYSDLDPNNRRVGMILNIDHFNPALVRVSDQIRFNYQGLSWTINGPDAGPDGKPDGVIDSQPADPQDITVSMDTCPKTNTRFGQPYYRTSITPIGCLACPTRFFASRCERAQTQFSFPKGQSLICRSPDPLAIRTPSALISGSSRS